MYLKQVFYPICNGTDRKLEWTLIEINLYTSVDGCKLENLILTKKKHAKNFLLKNLSSIGVFIDQTLKNNK